MWLEKSLNTFSLAANILKDMFRLLNYISTEQSVKILVQSLANCKSYGDIYDGVSAFIVLQISSLTRKCGSNFFSWLILVA